MAVDSAIVVAILGKDYDSENERDLTPYITTAEVLASQASDMAIAQARPMSVARLEMMEAWLAAHFYACSDRPYDKRTIDKDQYEFAGKTDGKARGLSSTLYGQTAILLDTSGYLSSLIGSVPDAVAAAGAGGGSASVSGPGDGEEVINSGANTGVVPIVTASAINRNIASTVYYIDGLNFDTVAGNNKVQFSLGMKGTVTNSTSTRLTVSVSTLPTTAGNLMCQVTIKANSSASTQVATVVQTALVGHWPCNEGTGTTVHDLINGIDLEFTDSPSWDADTPGAIAGAGGCLTGDAGPGTLSARAQNDVVDPSLLPKANQSRTVAFWYILDGIGDVMVIYGGGAEEVGDVDFAVARDSTTLLMAEFGGYFIDDTFPETINEWHHFAFVWNGVDWKHYEDGVQVGSGSSDPLQTKDGGTMLIRLDAGDGAKIKDLRIYNSDIPLTKVQELAGV